MRTFQYILFAFFLLLANFTTKAETITATFDFSSNNYGFAVCPNINEIGTAEYIIKPETIISSNEVSITLAPSPFKASSKYAVNWRGDLNALYYNNLSHFIIKTTNNEALLNKVVITFANGMNGDTGYFFNTYTQNKVQLNNYTLTNDIGTLDLSDNNYAEIHWFNSTDKKELQIKKIDVTYSLVTSALDKPNHQGYNITVSNSTINVTGNYDTIEVYNISGAIISRNKPTIECPIGIYIVKVNNAAHKVVVK